MNEQQILQWLTDELTNVQVLTQHGQHFLFVGADRMLPFVTVMTSDLYDQASQLERPGIYRLNLGVGPRLYRQLFGNATLNSHDFTALDTLMPHPEYAAQGWVCVLNPSSATFADLQPLLRAAHERAARRAGLS
ncbi:DUF6194 family protein [Deinococcus sonorensis]|uniref:DUF6194 family protein n=2 Tax=Deinococcus sonorensis TaxID=309891 RepID=A0AAU7UD85_9DEIO